MFVIGIKEWTSFFSNLTGYVTIIIFLLLTGLFLFVFPNTSLLEYGYATLEPFFNIAPWIMLFLISTITMRSFADEFKSGTFELLRTWPLSYTQIIMGKYVGCFCVVLMALLPTSIYVYTIQHLSVSGGIDVGATIGSYLGLLLLCASFTAIGIFTSSLTNNTIIAFVASAFTCVVLYSGFNAISKIPAFQAGADYYIEMLGIDFHYKNISRGVVDTRDVIYFISIISIFLLAAKQQLQRKK